MGTHGIFHFYTFMHVGGKMHATRDMQIASRTHFPQTYIKQAQCWYSLEGN